MNELGYELDYKIQTRQERCEAVRRILNSLRRTPSNIELENFGTYILRGRDPNGTAPTLSRARSKYSTYRTKEETNLSLEALREDPHFDETLPQRVRPRANSYTTPVPKIRRPTKDDPIGDSDIPGMRDLQETIDNLAATLKDPPASLSPYKIYKLKHLLAEYRQYQQYLKRAYKPTLQLLGIDHPRPQFINQGSDATYDIPYSEQVQRVNDPFRPARSKNLADYAHGRDANGDRQVRWVVRAHTFNQENPLHVREMLRSYADIRATMREELTSWAETLLLDTERYVRIMPLDDAHRAAAHLSMQGVDPASVSEILRGRGVQISEAAVRRLLRVTLPTLISEYAIRTRILHDTPKKYQKTCTRCGRTFPPTLDFFYAHAHHKDGLSTICKECQNAQNRAKHLEVKKAYERIRSGNAGMHAVPPSETNN